MTPTMYGIPNCDTVRKARRALEDRGIGYDFHDYKKAGVDAGLLRQWVDRLGWEKLLNRSGMTFRKLSDADKADIDEDKAIRLMMTHPSAIRRPVLVHGDDLIVGHDADRYAALAG